MATTDDARARARRIVEETLLEAGLATPRGSSQDAPLLLEGADAAPANPQPPSRGTDAAATTATTNGSGDPAPRPDEVEADSSDAAAHARRIVAEVIAARAAEDARRAAEAQRCAVQIGPAADEEPARSGDRTDTESRSEGDPEPAAEMFEDAEPAVELATEPELEFDRDTDVAAPPTAAVDLLPAEPASPPPPQTAAPKIVDEPAPELDEPPLPGGPAIGGPPPPPLAAVDGWWQTIRERYRRRQAMAEWAPDATRPPRRTGRWLLVTLLALGAIVLLYPMAVDALRQLVAL